jgi:RNA polymerase sigma-70 factor, ECF subfamily
VVGSFAFGVQTRQRLGKKEFGCQTYGCIEFRPRRAVKDPDSALKRSAVGGDRKAVERLFRDLYPPVFGFCFSMTRNRTDAEDLAQQTFLKAFASLRTFRPARPIGPWILRIAHNLFISQLRSRRPQTDLDDPELEPLASSDPAPEAVAISEETREEVRRGLRSLPPPAQVILVLRYQQQLSYEEISVVLDMPVTTVTNRLFEARRQLETALRQTGEGGTDAFQLVGS